MEQIKTCHWKVKVTKGLHNILANIAYPSSRISLWKEMNTTHYLVTISPAFNLMFMWNLQLMTWQTQWTAVAECGPLVCGEFETRFKICWWGKPLKRKGYTLMKTPGGEGWVWIRVSVLGVDGVWHEVGSYNRGHGVGVREIKMAVRYPPPPILAL